MKVQAKVPHKMTFLCQKENYLEKPHVHLENKVKSDKIPVDIETSFCEESLPVFMKKTIVPIPQGHEN